MRGPRIDDISDSSAESPIAGDDSGRRPVRLVLPGLLLATGLFSAFYPTLLSGFGQVQQDLGDPRLVNYLLEHTFRWLHRWPQHGSLWSPPFYHPAAGVGAFHDTMVGLGPLYWPWRWLGLAPDTAYQAFMLAVTALNFVAAYGFMRTALRLDVGPSGAGAFLFAFANARMARLLHQQLVAGYLPVLAVLALVVAFRHETPKGRRVALWAFFGLLAAQMWSGFYYAWYLIFCVGLAVAWATALRTSRQALRAFVRDERRTIMAAAAAFLVVSAPMILEHLRAAQDIGFPDFALEVLPRTPRPISWLYMGTPNLLYGLLQDVPAFSSLPMPVEQQLASGFFTTAVALMGLVAARHRPVVRCLLVVGVALALASTLLPGGFTVWRWIYEWVPGAAAVRAPARSALVLLLPLSAGFALAIAALEARGRYLLAALVLALCVVEQVRFQPSFDKSEARAAVSRVAESVPDGCPSFYAVSVPPSSDPLPYNPWKYHLDAMWAQLELGTPTVNGHSGYQPAGWLPLYDNVVRSDADRIRLSDALRVWTEERGAPEVCAVDVLAR